MTPPENDALWSCLSLTPEQVEFGFVDIIRAELEEIWIARGALEGFTVWLKEQAEVTEIYFSPGCSGGRRTASLPVQRSSLRHAPSRGSLISAGPCVSG